MASLRSNVELCLVIDGVGVLIAGWVFQPEPGPLGAVLYDDASSPIDLVNTWIRLHRPDVLDFFTLGATEAVLAANRKCGFLALAPLTEPRSSRFAPRLELRLGEATEDTLVVQLAPDPLTEPLDPGAAAFLRHNVRPLLDTLRRHRVQGHPSVRRLIEGLGPEAIRVERSTDAPPSSEAGAVGVDLCVLGIDEGILLVGWFTGGPENIARAGLVTASADVVDILPFMHFLPQTEEAGLLRERRFVAAIPSSAFRAISRRLGLRVELVDGATVVANAPVSSGPDALTRFADVLDSGTWLALSEAVAEHWSSLPGPMSAESISLALRPLARRGHDATQHVFEVPVERIAAAIDHAFVVPNLGVFTVGWLLDPDDQVRSLHVHIGDGPSPDLLPDLIRLPRPDITREYARWLQNANSDRFGFAFLASIKGVRTESLAASLYYTVRSRSGVRRRLRAATLRRCEGNPLPTIREILGLVPPSDVAGLARHVGPVVESLWNDRPELTNTDPVLDVGDPPEHPAVSVIVPIYGRHDFIEYQLSLFADDPDWKDTELIYVVDDPRLSEEAVRLCREIYPLYRIPVRVVACRHNRGFAAANNIGAAIARGRLIVLLNSDVMPKRAGWVSELRRLYDSLPSPGALGPKLLFPDGALQHAGMSFEQLPRYPGLWLNGHPGKGLPSVTAPKGTIVSVPAITAACLMVSRELYLRAGGLDEGYILGDFEDSDFCLKLRRLGRQICCAPSVELYHLERQSQRLIGTNEWRGALTLYNAWLHTKRWGDSIDQLARENV